MKTINKPNIVDIVKSEGVELRQKGRYYWGLCSLHSERTPSFCVNPETQRFKCFGCGASGDAIDFIQKLKGLSFPDVLAYLNISGNKQAKHNPQETRRRELVGKFKEWCSNYSRWLGEMLKQCHRIDSLVVSQEQLGLTGLDGMYIKRDLFEYHMSILIGRNDNLKLELYKEVMHVRN